MGGRARVLAALAGERVRPVPVGAATQSATIAQMDAAGVQWPEAHGAPEAMARLAECAATLAGFELVHVPFDQTVEAGLLGADVDPGGRASNCALRTHPFPLTGAPPAVPDFSAGRAAVVAEAIRLLRARVGEDAAVCGGIVGPFTLVCQLAGVTEVVMDSLRKPDRVRPWLEFAVRAGAAYARLQLEAGADAITIEDMSASLDLTSPRIYQNLILPAQRALIAAIPGRVILHVCGSNTKILPLMAEAGASALSLEAATDLAAAAKMGRSAIAGGVPTVEVLLNGSRAAVRAASEACLQAGVHILAPGCGVPPATSNENLKEMVSAAREWQA